MRSAGKAVFCCCCQSLMADSKLAIRAALSVPPAKGIRLASGFELADKFATPLNGMARSIGSSKALAALAAFAAGLAVAVAALAGGAAADFLARRGAARAVFFATVFFDARLAAN